MDYEVIEQIDGGFRVGETDTQYVDVMRMLFNWRITTTPKNSPLTYDGGWCYVGTGPGVLLKAIAAAKVMAATNAAEPLGWNKNVMTGEWRENGESVGRSEDHGHAGENLETEGAGGGSRR